MEWKRIDINDKQPSARYGHSACKLGSGKVLVVGGKTAQGRWASDAWILDLRDANGSGMKWERLGDGLRLPGSKGTSVLPWKGTAVLLTGLQEGTDIMHVYVLKGDRWEWAAAGGEHIPRARCGHTACMTGESTLVVFGGEDGRRQALPGTHVLDLERMEWDDPAKVLGREPAARCEHASVSLEHGRMLLFGGATANGGHVFSDVHELDLRGSSPEWRQVEVRGQPQPRAGHVALPVDHSRACLFFGGGDGRRGMQDAALFNRQDGLWEEPSPGPPAVGEGAAAASISPGRAVVFGGYDGRAHGHLYEGLEAEGAKEAKEGEQKGEAKDEESTIREKDSSRRREGLEEEVKRLREEMEQKDARLEERSKEVERLNSTVEELRSKALKAEADAAEQARRAERTDELEQEVRRLQRLVDSMRQADDDKTRSESYSSGSWLGWLGFSSSPTRQSPA